MALPTAAAIRALVLPQITGTGEDTFLDTQIAAADAALADWCLFPRATPATDRTLEATAYTFTLDGPDADDPSVLRTNMPPITTLTSIKQDTNGTWTYATTESSSGYLLDPETGTDIYTVPGSTIAWGSGRRYIQIVATCGYNVGAHVVLTQAIALLVAHWFATRRTQGVTSLTQGAQAAVVADKGIPIHVQELMWPYRLTGRER